MISPRSTVYSGASDTLFSFYTSTMVVFKIRLPRYIAIQLHSDDLV